MTAVPPPGGEPLLPVATGLRLRGGGGRLTASLVPGGVDQLAGRREVHIGRAGGPASLREIEAYTIYGRKLVLKLRGIDTAAAASVFEGQDILMSCNGLVDLPEGAYYIFELVGMQVSTRSGRRLGIVTRIMMTGAAPLLVVETDEDGQGERKEILVPAARSICCEIDTANGRIVIDPPEGLLEL